MRCSLKEVALVLAVIAAALSAVVALGEPVARALVPGFFGALLLVIGAVAIGRARRERQAQAFRHGETVAARLATRGQRAAVGPVPVGPRVYQPTAVHWGASLVVLAFLVLTLVLAGRLSVRSPGGAVFFCLVLGLVVLTLYSTDRRWVLLYEDHLEVHGILGKVLADRFGLRLTTPTRIPYGHIRILRGLGEHGNLVIVWRTPDGRWQEHLIASGQVANHTDIEAELLRRVPSQCELHPDPQRYLQLPWVSKRKKQGRSPSHR